MKIRLFLITLLITFGLASCSQKEEKVSVIKEKNLEMQMIDAYKEGLKEFNRGDIFSETIVDGERRNLIKSLKSDGFLFAKFNSIKPFTVAIYLH